MSASPTAQPIESAINPASSKAFETLRAECALAGVSLVQSSDERGHAVYIVSRWALTRELADLAAVSAWLQMVTGVKR